MHITITGHLGSGKSTISGIIEKDYGFQAYSTGAMQREIAIQHNVSTLEMNKIMTQDISYDKLIDDATEKISNEKKDEKIIFDSRMAWKFAVNSFKIFVVVDPLVAATRVMANPRGNVEIYVSLEDAKQKMIERGNVENKRFMEYYGVDTFDYSNYNLIIDSTYASANELAKTIYDKYNEFITAEIKPHQILLSPTSLFPLAGIYGISDEILHKFKINKAYLSNPISIVAFGGYHYIVDGHYRALAAIQNNEMLVEVIMADITAHPVMKTPENLVSEIQAVGKSAVSDFEKAGKFRYSSYPTYYHEDM